MHVSAIIAAGGRGTRFGGSAPKQIRTVAGIPILQRSVDAFLRSERVHEVVVALPSELVAEPPAYLVGIPRLSLVEGGARRQDSVANAFARLPHADIVVIHDAARPLVSDDVIARTIDAAIVDGAAIAAVQATDTVKRGDREHFITGTVPRDEVYLAQTPQAFRADVLRAALAMARRSEDATDEAMLAEQAGHRVRLVTGARQNLKITTQDDLEMAERLLAPPGAVMRVGTGYDLHRLVAGRPLVLGGVTIPFEKGLDGHSDADAICHAVTDAITGVTGVGDIGRLFPDTDPRWKGADSVTLLREAQTRVRAAGWEVVNVDVVVIAQRPKLVPFLDAMRRNLAAALGLDIDAISIKGKTNEGVDSMGHGESIAVHAVALVQRAHTPGASA